MYFYTPRVFVHFAFTKVDRPNSCLSNYWSCSRGTGSAGPVPSSYAREKEGCTSYATNPRQMEFEHNWSLRTGVEFSWCAVKKRSRACSVSEAELLCVSAVAGPSLCCLLCVVVNNKGCCCCCCCCWPRSLGLVDQQ